MEVKRHLKIAKLFKKAAEEADKKRKKDKDWTLVASQNFFYAGIQAIEAILAKHHLHPTSHRETSDMMKELIEKEVFTVEEVMKHTSIRRGPRRRAGYMGREGRDYQKIKEFSEYFLKKASEA